MSFCPDLSGDQAQIDLIQSHYIYIYIFLQASTTCLDSNYRCERLDLRSEQMYMFEYLSLGKTYDPFKLTFLVSFFQQAD